MKLQITIKERGNQEMEVRIHRPEGMSTDFEAAWGDKITEAVKIAIPMIGDALYGKGSVTESGRGHPPTN